MMSCENCKCEVERAQRLLAARLGQVERARRLGVVWYGLSEGDRTWRWELLSKDTKICWLKAETATREMYETPLLKRIAELEAKLREEGELVEDRAAKVDRLNSRIEELEKQLAAQSIADAPPENVSPADQVEDKRRAPQRRDTIEVISGDGAGRLIEVDLGSDLLSGLEFRVTIIAGANGSSRWFRVCDEGITWRWPAT